MVVSDEEWRCCIAILLLTLREPPAATGREHTEQYEVMGFQFGSSQAWVPQPTLCAMEVTALQSSLLAGDGKVSAG